MNSTMRFFFTIFFLFCAATCFSQNKKITAYKTFGGVVYELNDSITISPKQVSMLLRSNSDAFHEFKIARGKNSIAAGLGFTGGVLVAIPLVTAIAGGEPEWWYAAAGGGLVALSVPFLWSYRAHANNALDAYNKGQQAKSARLQPSFFFNGTQAGLVIRF